MSMNVFQAPPPDSLPNIMQLNHLFYEIFSEIVHSGFNKAKSKTSDVASSFVYVGTSIGSSVYNAANEIIHEGIHDGDAYDKNLYSAKIYKLENWRLKVVVDYQKAKSMSDEDYNELALSTLSVVFNTIKIFPELNLYKTAITNKIATIGVNIAIKTVLKIGVKKVLNQ